MEEFVKDENSKNLIFTEDLKNMVHLTQNEDCPLVVEMIKRFCSQSKEVRFGNFIFGPVIMRLFHHLQDSDTALSLFKDESLNGFFDQLITYQILLDLLYKKGKYQEILDTFNIIRERQLQGSRYPKHSIILVFAACYKLNTPASFEYATKIWHGAIEAGHIPLRRATVFMAYLAINQNSPHIALEVLATLKGQNYVTVRSLKTLALAQMSRFDDCLRILRSILEVANPMMNKQTIPYDIIELLKKEFAEKNKDEDLQSDFDKTINFLVNHEHVTSESLEKMLCSEINVNIEKFQPQKSFQNQSRRTGYSKRGGGELDRPSKLYSRPGLHELN